MFTPYAFLVASFVATVVARMLSWNSGYDVEVSPHFGIVLVSTLVPLMVFILSTFTLFRRNRSKHNRLIYFGTAATIFLVPFFLPIPAQFDGFESRMREYNNDELRSFESAVRQALTLNPEKERSESAFDFINNSVLVEQYSFLALGDTPPRIEVSENLVTVSWRSGVYSSLGLHIWRDSVDPSHYDTPGIIYKTRPLYSAILLVARKS